MPSPTRTTLALTALNAALLFSIPAQAQTTSYERAFASAHRLEQRGQYRAAARALERIAASFPDDYDLALQLGWLYYRAEDYAVARQHYERALTLSQGESRDARLGIETCRRLEPRALRAFPALWFGAQLYGNHPQRRSGFSLSPSLSVQLFDLVLVSASYRYASYDFLAQPPSPPGVFSSYQQQSVQFGLGITRPNFTVQAHFGYVWDPSNTTVPAYVYGVTSRISLLGNLQLEASGTTYTDYSVFRTAAAWAIRLSPYWSLGPTASLQYGNGSVGGSFGGQLGFLRDGYGFTLAGRYGDEVRPTFLNEALSYATNDHLRGSVSALVRLPLGAGLSLNLGYEWQRFQTSTTTSSSEVDGHYFSTGLSAAW